MELTEQQIADLQNADLLTREAKAMYDNARLIREREIRRIAAEGGTYREIARFAGVAYQRVAQIVSGRPAITRPPDDHLEVECPDCGVDVGESCEGKNRHQAHLGRNLKAYDLFIDRHPEIGD